VKKALLAGREGGTRKAEVMATELGYLWANLLQRGAIENHRTIGFCAIADDEGANSVAANLAVFLGAKGKRCQLVEATLRKPVLAAMFQTSHSPGLADWLGGRAVVADIVRYQVAPGVDLVPGGESADPFWGFTTDRFGRLLKELLTNHELCLVDVPALNRAPEASLVVRSLDAVVLVVEANRHRAEVVQRNVASLRALGTPFLGVVLGELVHEVPTLLSRYL
jgi:Mrp family chromosome partitioning ATPase